MPVVFGHVAGHARDVLELQQAKSMRADIAGGMKQQMCEQCSLVWIGVDTRRAHPRCHLRGDIDYGYRKRLCDLRMHLDLERVVDMFAEPARPGGRVVG